MSVGPVIIFDKSMLQALSYNESVWLDNFFINNITPLFFVETLADIEKEVHDGRSAEDVVENIAYRTPDMGYVNIHHKTLMAGELMGYGSVEMSGKPILSGSKTVEFKGRIGIVFEESPEMKASSRWERKEFLEIEREAAKNWRQELAKAF